MAIDSSAAGAILFLALYFVVFLWMIHGFITKRLSFKSRYSVLLLHCCIRLASQSLNIAFLDIGFDNISVFVAYLVLGAEGYFSLVVCSFRFLIRWERSYSETRVAWLEPYEHQSKAESRKRIAMSFLVFPTFWPSVARKEPELPAHAMMVVANTLIITGGSYVSAALDPNNDLTQSEINDRLSIAKALRTTGQVLLVSINVFLGFALVLAYRRQARNVKPKPHPTLLLLCLTWIPLIIRGIYSILQSAVWSLSYYDENNYSSHGFTSSFTTLQDCFGVLPEFIAVILLNLTSHMDLKYPPPSLTENDGKQEGKSPFDESPSSVFREAA